MLDNLREARATAAAAAESLLSGEEVSVEALDAAEARSVEIADLDGKISKAEALEARTAELAASRAAAGVKTFGSTVVTREERTYEKDGNNSFVRDMIGATLRNDQNSWARLQRHQQEAIVESRDISRTDGAGGDFVPPIWLMNEYAEFARAARVTADLVTKMALPAGKHHCRIAA